MSCSARANSLAESGLKPTAATPAGRSSISASSVTRAVESANSLSSLAPLRRLRPNRMSVRATTLPADRPAHLLRNLGQACEALLEGRMREEELARPLLHRGRDDEKGVHALDLAEV